MIENDLIFFICNVTFIIIIFLFLFFWRWWPRHFFVTLTYLLFDTNWYSIYFLYILICPGIGIGVTLVNKYIYEVVYFPKCLKSPDHCCVQYSGGGQRYACKWVRNKIGNSLMWTLWRTNNVAIIDCFVSVSLTQPGGKKRLHDLKCINFPVFNLHGGVTRS